MMNNVSKTLYIPLYGKAYVSKAGILLHDPKAEAIWRAEGFELKGKAASKWLSYYMAMRAGVFDRWTKEKMEQNPEAVVLHLGCGLDSRAERVGIRSKLWVDVDLPDVIAQRRRFYQESDGYRMHGGDITESSWLEGIESETAIVVMEGISMYLPIQAMKGTFDLLGKCFQKVYVLMDCYSTFAAKASRVRNPVNEVGVYQVYGLDDPCLPECSGLRFTAEHAMTPAEQISILPARDQWIFRKLYAGKLAQKMYHLWEYRKD